MLRVLAISLFVTLSPTYPHPSHAQDPRPLRDPAVIKVIRLDYANAEHLASVLAPLLSSEGWVVAYRPTDSLIIRDRASIVKGLVMIIKGNLDP